MTDSSGADLSPAQSVELVLEALERAAASGNGPPSAVMPMQLAAADFSPAALGQRPDADPSWWSAARRGAALVEVDFTDRDLRNANMYRADLRRSCFDGAKAQAIDLRSTCLCEASLQGADLRFANLTAADLSGADLDNADLWRAGIGRADLSDASLREVRMAGATLGCRVPAGSARRRRARPW